MELEVRLITDNYPTELLLLADETMEAIDKYLYTSDVYVVRPQGSEESIAVCCLYPIDKDTVEVKNIAVSTDYQGQGIGSFLLKEMEQIARAKQYKEVIIGTGDCGFRQIHFYEKNGYTQYGLKKNFFIENYSQPIFENGIQLKDMVLLKKEILNNPPVFTIRTAALSDISALSQLFKETVLTVNLKNYSKEEVEDWASCGNDLKHLEELITNLYFIVAENEQRVMTGFAAIREDGYLDLMFIHKDFQRKGIATILYKDIERYAHSKGMPKITSEVSITAKPFFEKQGFGTDKEQKRKANRLCLTNYWMSKELTSKK